jgi:tRNA-dihydrouridine synthase A
MMDHTDRHFRYFLRLLSRRTLLYTEMITTGAILQGDRARALDFSPEEHPLALQLGGDDPAKLAECARLAEAWGYDEVNLNVGCPSSRVQEGSFGVCLMAQPQRVADAVAAMRAATSLPVTVKHRIGFDDLDRYEDMLRFVDVVAGAGADRFSVHARKAWLQGLSPKQNRTVPPLRYDDVYRLKRERPELQIEINGGIETLAQVGEHLRRVDAVMIGRAAARNPYLFASVDRELFGEQTPAVTRHQVAEAMLPYVERMVGRGVPARWILGHMQPLFAGIPGARRWRQRLASGTNRSAGGAEVLREALAAMPRPEPRPAGTAGSGPAP